ncbi:MAG: HAD-IIIA family hydrolase [Synergistes sp.]|nr:HAD-IIIA family hydrolase [Synergistes sp.]
MIKLFAMDVDGTLTDGGIYMDGTGGEMKRFDVQDGQGIVRLLAGGVKIVFISGRFSAPTEQRAKNLRITRCVNGVADKLSALKDMADEWGILQSETAYAGDDAPDIECIKWSGLGIAVANAVSAVKDAADMVTENAGGHGAVREACEYIMTLNER